MDRFDAGRQPAGRPPAPGRLAYVQAFLNTFWDLDARRRRRVGPPAAYGPGCGRAASPAPPRDGDLERAIELREALRALCLANHDAADAPRGAGRPGPHRARGRAGAPR